MSILRKPYEISIWDDIWDVGQQKFVESRYAVIGSNTMKSQNRVLEPSLTRNVNGTKKLTFKMCKRYKDNITGETIINPFVEQLVSERKVKLNYNGDWYDFIVKNVQEDSSNYIYTYQLEDALVNELSKNGFEVVLDDTLQNNSGTAQELATSVLRNTDWTVDNENSDVLVQTVEEPLVYITIPEGTQAYRILDPQKVNNGTCLNGVTVDEEKVDVGGCTALAFYSCLRNKPVFFQFIVLGEEENFGKISSYNEENVKHDENRVILEDNCQYYIKYLDANSYNNKNEKYGFDLPEGFEVEEQSETNGIGDEYDTTISSWHRGARYGFSQKTVFEPKLERYVNVYTKGATNYRGYSETKFTSPELIQNIISNTTFKNSSGWTGAYYGGPLTGTTEEKKNKKGSVKNVFGRFTNKFVEASDELAEGDFNSGLYAAYMKLYFPNQTVNGVGAAVINSGPFDNRISIGYMDLNSKWVLAIEMYDSAGRLIADPIAAGFNFSLEEASYNSSGDNEGAYTKATNEKLALTKRSASESVPSSVSDNVTLKGYVFEVTKNSYKDKKTFKDKAKLRLVITNSGNSGKEFYIKEAQLFERVEYITKNGETAIVIPNNQNEETMGGIISQKYYYYNPSELNDIKDKEDFQPSVVREELDNETYVPQFNTKAEKIRSVTAKESNYFNILQTIAETFEAWMLIKVTRDALGGIVKKQVIFKQYIGEENFANFRYGVNLKDIKRTFESKQIVTKLIVKDNSNEFANNGFCTIVRAGSNPLGENFIYDFQYYFNQNLLNATDYLNTLYSFRAFDESGQEVESMGEDIAAGQEFNLIGYYPRLRKINDDLNTINEQLQGLSTGLLQLQAQAEIQKQTCISALEEIEEYAKEFEYLTSYSIVGGNWPAGITDRSDVKKVLQKYSEVHSSYSVAAKQYEKLAGTAAMAELAGKTVPEILAELHANLTAIQRNSIDGLIPTKEEEISNLEAKFNTIAGWKSTLNKLFFTKYSRFIQEGTWISEEYTDDEKYYTDALSVLYNSCYPKVAYQIGVLELSGLSGYEKFAFNLGDRTYVEDLNFFGTDQRMQVVLTELTEYLDSPEKNTVKVQNFKNQFQDLFQKITATVQQAQYNTGSYEKAVALAEANQAKKMTFLTDALAGASAMLTAAGQQSVTWGSDGITVTDLDSPNNSIRMIGGAILLSKQDSNGRLKWTTGITHDGVSASLITAGVLNAGEIQIMNSDEPMFRWDSYGITAFNFKTQEGVVVSGSIKHNQFVRMDKFGIYGIDGTKNGLSWTPESVEDVLRQSTFALTREGLLIDKASKIKLNIGYNNGKVIEILSKSPNYKKSNKTVLSIDEEGNARFAGQLVAATGHFVGSISIGSLTEDPEDYETTGVPTDPMFSVNSQGNVRIRKGGIYLGEPLESGEDDYIDTNSNFDGYHYPFSVNEYGVLRAVSGHIGGWDLTTNGLSYIAKRGTSNYYMIFAPQGISGYYVYKYVNGVSTKTLCTNAVMVAHSGGTSDGVNFVVDAGGYLYARSAHITGSINSEEGRIGGWRITQNAISRGDTINSSGVLTSANYYFGQGYSEKINTDDATPTGIALKIQTGFRVTQDGILYASGAHIEGSGTFTGTIEANGGHIGSWSIGTGLSNGTVFLHPTGASGQVTGFDQQNYVFKAGTGFGVTSGGVLHASGAIIKGNSKFYGNGEFTGYVKATSGEIGGCTIDTVKGLQVSSAHITSVNASTITTGTLSANRINGGTLSGCSLNINNGTFQVGATGILYLGSGSKTFQVYSDEDLGKYGIGWHWGQTAEVAFLYNLVDRMALYFVKGIFVGFLDYGLDA